jgi:hypothetical protein
MSRGQNDENNSNSDLRLINDIRQTFMEKYIQFQSANQENLNRAAKQLQDAVMMYYRALRNHVKMDLPDYWKDKILYRTDDDQVVRGLNELDRWTYNFNRQVEEKEDFFGKTEETVNIERNRMPINMMIRSADLLEEAYKKLGLAQETNTKHNVSPIEDKIRKLEKLEEADRKISDEEIKEEYVGEIEGSQ